MHRLRDRCRQGFRHGNIPNSDRDDKMRIFLRVLPGGTFFLGLRAAGAVVASFLGYHPCEGMSR